MAEPAPAAGANPPVVAPDELTKHGWPPPEKELETWMMNTVKEGDAGARFLRTMLQMNPAYGTYLQTDPDLVSVVAMFSKRIKTKVSQYDTPANIPPTILTQPLCELVWRVVGYVMHSVVELEEEANMPVPKEASGMIRMLLHTNTTLSNKLNESRRTYLKELSEHRDKQRRISKVAAAAVANLTEQPIMFFEPLEYILDETTKDFIRESVVERIKLEMRQAFANNDDNSEMQKYIDELETQLEAMKAEMKNIKAANNRMEAQMASYKEKDESQREEIRTLKEGNKEKDKTLAERDQEIQKLKDEILNKNNRIKHLETKLGEIPAPSTANEVEVQFDDNTEEMEQMRQKNCHARRGQQEDV